MYPQDYACQQTNIFLVVAWSACPGAAIWENELDPLLLVCAGKCMDFELIGDGKCLSDVTATIRTNYYMVPLQPGPMSFMVNSTQLHNCSIGQVIGELGSK
jgi:hypothetical protein